MRRLPLLSACLLLGALRLSGASATVSPAVPTAGEMVTLSYDPAGGPLASASRVYVHRGFNDWAQVAVEPEMVRAASTGIFSLTYKVPEAAFNLNFAFHDGSGTWDNNSTRDWHFSVNLAPAPEPLPEASVPLPNASSAHVMMQGFYWDVPAGNWYNYLADKAEDLRNMASGYGIDRIWFPPPSKAQSGPFSMGYDPFDYYDLGQYNQKGTVRTRFGTQAELKAAIAAFKAVGIEVMADIVLNHRSGGNWQLNPVSGQYGWTDFSTVASGQCTWDYNDFHPSSYEHSDEGAFADFPDVCYAHLDTPGDPAYDMIEWARWLMEPANAGFTGGWRFDFVKGLPPSILRAFRAGTGNAFAILECWDGMPMVEAYVRSTAGASAFDFPGYYTLRDICNDALGAGDITRLVDPERVFAARNPDRAVTFVANHDTDEITRNRMLAYAFILTFEGYPCIFWKDYVDRGYDTLGGQVGNGIDPLVWARGALAGGHPELEILKSDSPDLLVYGTKNGSVAHPGYIVVLNDHPSANGTATVTTSNPALRNRTLRCYAWYSALSSFNAEPPPTVSNDMGDVTVVGPARGYAVYGPSNIAVPRLPNDGYVAASDSIEVEVGNTLVGHSYRLLRTSDPASAGSWHTAATFAGSETDRTIVEIPFDTQTRLFLQVEPAE